MSSASTDISSSKYLNAIACVFVSVLLISNIVSTKLVSFWGITFDAGTILFPLSYIFGDVLTEVYGYNTSRRVIWSGFFCAILMSVVFYIVQVLPAASDWNGQAAYEQLLGFVPRIVFASLIAYWTGEFANSYVLSRMKIRTKGSHLWLRTISSTIIGEWIDTILFCSIAFYGAIPNSLLLTIILSNYFFKCSVEILFTPLTYLVVNFLKSKERCDVYDHEVAYNPFAIRC